MWWNVGPHLKKRLMKERRQRQEQSQGDSNKTGSDLAPKTLQGFLDILRHKFGTVVRAWRKAMDTDQSGTLTFREFSHALERVGYHGDFRSLWYQLDSDMSGCISLHEMDPVNAQRLEKFRMLCIKQHGSMAGAWRRVMDVDNSGSCWLHEFQEACRNLGYTDGDEIKVLFDLLDINETQQLTFECVNFLQCWEEEKKLDEFRQRLPTSWVNKDPFMFVGDSTTRKGQRKASKGEVPKMEWISKEQEAELRQIFKMCDSGDWLQGAGDNTISVDELHKAATMNKEVSEFLELETRQGVEKFFKHLDSDENGEVTWEEFKAYYIRQLIQGKSKLTTKSPTASPEKPKKLATARLSLGEAPDLIGDGGPDLEDWSAPATQDHKEVWLHFQRFLEGKYGTLSKAFDAMDANESGSLSMVEFQSVVGTLQYVLPSGSVCRASDSKRLFMFAVGREGGAITWKEFGITPQEWIEHGHFKRRLQISRQATSADRGQKALADHTRRILNPLAKTELSFGLPLPKGWGFPPNFHPADSYFGRRHGPDHSADSKHGSPQKGGKSPEKTRGSLPHRESIATSPVIPPEHHTVTKLPGTNIVVEGPHASPQKKTKSPLKNMKYIRGSAQWPGMCTAHL